MTVEEHADTHLPKPFVFVLMPFDRAFDDIYTFGIKGASQEVGAYAERLDEQIFTDGMLDRIFNQISKADVVVADMTGRNANVFYEVSYAHALGKIVLLLTQRSEDIPFDLQHRQHLVYGGSIQKLREDLAPRLRWAIGQSRERAQGAGATHMTVHLAALQLREHKAEPVPLHVGVRTDVFFLPLSVRNDSLESLPAITHIYLFAEPNSGIVPFDYVDQRVIAAGVRVTTHIRRVAEQLRAQATPALPASDGLTEQFRMPNDLPPIPPGAVEQTMLQFMVTDDGMYRDARFRIRIHTASRFSDYRVTMRAITPESDDPDSSSSG